MTTVPEHVLDNLHREERPRGTAVEWIASNEDYHRDCSHVSNTAKEVFRKSQRLYRDLYVEKSRPFPESTDAMLFGQLVHIAVWEPMRWKGYVLAPKFDRRTTQGKADYSQWLLDNDGKQVVDPVVFAQVERIRQQLLDNPLCRKIIESDGPCEKSVRWLDDENGLPRKCRFDKVYNDRFIVDIKTSRDAVSPQTFARTVVNFGYQRAGAWYLDGLHALTGEAGRFLFMAIAKESGECALYELDEEAILLGYRENRMLIDRMARCFKASEWTAAFEKQVTTLSLPAWAFKNSDWEIEDGDQ